MKKLVSLLITMAMLLSVCGAFADAPPHVAAAFPFGDLGGVYSAEIERSMNRVGQITDPSSYIWKGLPWQYGWPNETRIAGSPSSRILANALLLYVTGAESLADVFTGTTTPWSELLAYLQDAAENPFYKLENPMHFPIPASILAVTTYAEYLELSRGDLGLLYKLLSARALWYGL